jgi:hypothetical protein
MNPPSSRSSTLVLSLALLGVTLLVWFWLRPETAAKPSSETATPSAAPSSSAPVATASLTPSTAGEPPEGTPPPLVGESILRGYASPASTPENDLTLMSRLMDNFTLLVKDAADRPLSANEDWAAAFRGVNPAHERFLPDQHVALNPLGQLVDRWNTPLFFHALGNRRHEIRSAGPDGKLWTADDLHRNADGTFRKGANVVGGELLDIAGDRERR